VAARQLTLNLIGGARPRFKWSRAAHPL